MDSASRSVMFCGMAQTKYLRTSGFSVYKVEGCGSVFSLENKSAGSVLGQDLE